MSPSPTTLMIEAAVWLFLILFTALALHGCFPTPPREGGMDPDSFIQP